MIKIISPEEYKKIPWKNGKGITTELAISEGGTIEQFDWRISIASVVEDGPFSDFSGMLRNLVLIEGEGIDLQHDGGGTDRLDNLLDFATFDGGCQTVGKLHSDPIKDFNIMTSKSAFETKVATHTDYQEVTLERSDLCFVFGLSESIKLFRRGGLENWTTPAQHLLVIDDEVDQFYVIGREMILACLTKI